MTAHLRLRAALLAAVVLVGLLAAAVAAAEPESPGTTGESLEPRIVGGVEVDPPGKYPFIAAVVFADEESTYWGQFCAGTLIDPWWVLTAGHCVSFAEGNRPWEIDVVVGRHDLRYGTDGERIGVADIYRHPGYNNRTLANDLALLRLERAATAGTPIELATADDAGLFAPGEIATVIGWGQTKGLPPGTPGYPDTLREVDVPMVSDVDCAAAYGSDFILPDQICAGDLTEGGVDACYGDSGGPLFVFDGGIPLHVGIVSTGNDCALPGYPGIYTRTATYTDWIEQTMAAQPLPTCLGRQVTLLGSFGSDTLEGTVGDDVIAARGGHDTVYAYGGNDLVCAGLGDDWVDAGDGDDKVLGDGGHDQLLGGAGADIMSGGPGNDRVFGGQGDDRLFGGIGIDEVRGGDGSDFIHGDGGPDRIFGEGGDDRIAGSPGDDVISGGEGRDTLSGNAGFDVLRGGPDVDTCFSGEDVLCEVVRAAVHVPL